MRLLLASNNKEPSQQAHEGQDDPHHQALLKKSLEMVTTQIPASPTPKPTFIIPVAAALYLLFGIGPNYLFALLACIVLVIGVFMLWRPGEAQILLFLFVFQWLQLATTIFYANLCRATLIEFLRDYTDVEYAITLAAIGLLFLAAGIRLGAGRQQAFYLDMIQSLMRRIPPTRWLKLHLIVWALSSASLVFAGLIPSLSQPLQALANMKWGTFLIFTIVTFASPKGPRLAWLAIFSVEFVMSLGGYFSSFTSVFLYTLIALTAIRSRISPFQVVLGAVVSAIMLVLGLYWTAIKPEYRSYVSGGQTAQVVVVGHEEAVQKLLDLIMEVTPEQLLNAADGLARRFSDIDTFSAVVTYVPSVVDHEWGKLWFDAISRPFMPRLFFPAKAVIDESELTNYYTGLGVAGSNQGTQISMGYIADSYIDFGEFGMMGVIFLFGYFVGWIHRWLINHPAGYGLLGCGLSSSTFIQLTSMSASSAKLVGGIVVCILVAFVVLNFLVPRYMVWLCASRQ
jgi:hypothetical protein